MTDTFTPCVHFVGFRDDRYWNAVKVFGLPDFVHVYWDYRAMADVAPGDTVVFATDKAQQIVPWSFDDSNQPHDPAAQERKVR
jgi:hypothetical protein